MNHFRLPNHLLVENDIFTRIPEALGDVFPSMARKKTIVVTEQNLKNLFQPLLDEIVRDFPESELFLLEKADYDTAAALAKKIIMEDIATVIGFGGGTVLDMAKFAAFVSKATLVSLPTTLSNDSIASPVAVLGTVGKARKTFKCKIPDAILVDPVLIKGAPKRQLLSGVGDTIAKYTALYDWKLASEKAGEKMDDFSYMISKMGFNVICYNTIRDVMSADFIKLLTQALVMGGLAMEIAGNSRPSSGSEHLFCHALEENFSEQVNVPHGIAVAMGSYPAGVFQKRKLPKIIKMIKDFEIPVKPSAYHITEEIFVKAWQQASQTRPDRYTILNETDLSDARLSTLYREMEEIF